MKLSVVESDFRSSQSGSKAHAFTLHTRPRSAFPMDRAPDYMDGPALTVSPRGWNPAKKWEALVETQALLTVKYMISASSVPSFLPPHI